MRRQTLAVLGVALVLLATLGSAGVVMALAGGSASPQTLQTSNSDDAETITVSAQGSAEADPDTAILRLAVESTSPDATAARTQVAENVSAVTQALLDLGIEDAQIRTTDYRIYHDDRRPAKEMESEAPVFRARHTLQVEIDDVDMVGQAIDAAVDAGATDIHDVRYTLAEDTRMDLRNEALTAAMENARSQADTLAESGELTITGVHDIATADYSGPVYRYETAYDGAAGASTEISSGPVSVTAQVTVTYNASG